jgi:hypothetical protein
LQAFWQWLSINQCWAILDFYEEPASSVSLRKFRMDLVLVPQKNGISGLFLGGPHR